MWLVLIAQIEFGTDVLDVAYGKTLATAGKDKTVRLWDPEGREQRVLRGHTGEVFSVRFAPDGSRLVTASEDDTIRIWDLEGKELLKLGSGMKRLYHHAPVFSQDGTLVAWGVGFDVVVHDAKDGRLVRKIETKDFNVSCVEFCPDGKRLVSADAYANVHAWEPITGKELPRGDGWSGSGIGFSSDGATLLTWGADGVRLWRISDTKEIRSFEKGQAVSRCALSPDGSRLAVAGRDGPVRILEFESGKQMDSFEGRSFAWSPDGRKIAVLHDGVVRIR